MKRLSVLLILFFSQAVFAAPQMMTVNQARYTTNEIIRQINEMVENAHLDRTIDCDRSVGLEAARTLNETWSALLFDETTTSPRFVLNKGSHTRIEIYTNDAKDKVVRAVVVTLKLASTGGPLEQVKPKLAPESSRMCGKRW